MSLPKTAFCDKHPERAAIAKFRYKIAGEEKLERVCLSCGDVWWESHSDEVKKTLVIEELKKEDLYEAANVNGTALQ